MTTIERPIQILSVEDNAADMRLISEILRMSKLRSKVDFVMDGIEALDYLLQKGKYGEAPRPDLILLDLNLPRLDGHDVLKEIKNHPELKRIPVLVLSGSRNRGDIHRSYEMHANTYIIKPFDLDELTAVMRGIEDYWMKIAQLPIDEPEEPPSPDRGGGSDKPKLERVTAKKPEVAPPPKRKAKRRDSVHDYK